MHLARFGDSGRVLVTADLWLHGGQAGAGSGAAEASLDAVNRHNLKFWELNEASRGGNTFTGDESDNQKAPWVLNSSVAGPHAAAALTAMACHATGALAATGADDGSLRIWARKTPQQQQQPAQASPSGAAPARYWHCERSIAYQSTAAVESLAFSADASVLVAAHGGLIALWAPRAGALLRTIISPVAAFSPLSRPLKRKKVDPLDVVPSTLGGRNCAPTTAPAAAAASGGAAPVGSCPPAPAVFAVGLVSIESGDGASGPESALVAATDCSIMVWDLLSEAMRW